MPEKVTTVPFSWERLMNAMERVRQRLERAAAALQSAGVSYAVAGGNAVAFHVSRVDESLVRNTRDVNILIRRSDFDAVRTALEAQGFCFSARRRHRRISRRSRHESRRRRSPAVRE
jgi:hypothetical protein